MRSKPAPRKVAQKREPAPKARRRRSPSSAGTARKQEVAASPARASETALEHYREIFDFAPIGYATLDADGTIREINFTGSWLFGHEREQIIGRAFTSFVMPPDVAVLEGVLRAAADSRSPLRVELELSRDGRAVPVRLTAAGRSRGHLVAFEDISERRAKELELARTEQELREVNRRKDDFLAMISHELRNPLSPIRTCVAVLQGAEPGSEMALKSLDIIARSATHLTRLVDDLLDVSRITRGLVELRHEPVELVSLIRRTIDDHGAMLAARGLKLDLQLGIPQLWLDGDPVRLMQVFSNLLGNADKFTPDGGQISIHVSYASYMAQIRFSDSGIGIAPDVIPFVFEPFAQAPQPLDRKRGGLGIGLAMVKSIVELHGGRVTVHSDGLGRGTQLLVALPVAMTRSHVPAGPSSPVGPPRRVLIIEDKEEVALSLEYALAMKGHAVRTARDGRSGIALASSFKPDVVLCDLGLPDIDGYEVATRFRREPTLRGTYLVALSGYVREEDVQRAHAAGFARHLAKPPNLEEIDRMLAALTPREAASVTAVH